jgi:hypothetical protein
MKKMVPVGWSLPTRSIAKEELSPEVFSPALLLLLLLLFLLLPERAFIPVVTVQELSLVSSLPK